MRCMVPLDSLSRDEEILLGPGHDVDDGVADAEDVETRFVHWACGLGAAGCGRRRL